MDQAITINSKAFAVIDRPSPTSTVFRTISRGAALPDFLRMSHQVTPSKVSPSGTVQRTLLSFGRTFTPDSGATYDVGYAKIQLELPSTMDTTNRDALVADLTDYIASAITLRTTNLGYLYNREVA